MRKYCKWLRNTVGVACHFYLFALLPLQAQGQGVVRGDCTPGLPADASTARSAAASGQRRLPVPTTQWDASKVYKQLVVLVAYSDVDFTGDSPRERYDMMLNEPGYNEGVGPGCLADYFREQSNGLFNVEFDVLGPFKVAEEANPYSDPTKDTRNYGASALKAATQMLIAQQPDLDYTQYDWNGDGKIEQVVYVVAGYAGNQGKRSYGYLWPNTSSFSTITTPDGMKISNYTVSAEMWLNEKSCGIGTICHEFSHSLGLPDIYPTGTSSSFYSVCDEWDLMDGGNFTNWGWCPPNYTAQEKMYLGWLTPTELSEPVTITGMEPISEGGETYIIHHTDTEYLLIENHQRTGWDAAAPGQGLLITHVDYSASVWSSNRVNANDSHFRYDIVHADNLHYEQWDLLTDQRALLQWVDFEEALYNHHLSTSPYPWQTDSTAVNNMLTDTSVPAAMMYNQNIAGEKILRKPVTNIVMADDGTISFDFCITTSISPAVSNRSESDHSADVYNLMGQKLQANGLSAYRSLPGQRKGLYICGGKKKILK